MVKENGKTRLAIVGASVRAAAQSALAAGFDVVAADLFADADLDGACPITKITDYPEGLADWLAEQNIDAWRYTGALENYPELVDRMAQIAPLWGVCGEALRRCRDPLVLQEVFRKAGVGFPATRLATGEEHREPGWLAKTYRHSNGAGVWPIRLTADARRALDENAYAQQAVAGREYGASFSIQSDGSAALLGVTEALVGQSATSTDDRGFLGALGPITPTPALRGLLARLGKVLSTDLRLRGPIGVDLIGEGSNWSVIEVNPRYTASVEVLTRSKAASPVQLFPIDSDHQAPRPKNAGLAGKQIVYSLRRLVVSAGFAEWAQHEAAKGRLADLPHTGTVIERGGPVCTRLATAHHPGELKRRLDAAKLDTLTRLYA